MTDDDNTALDDKVKKKSKALFVGWLEDKLTSVWDNIVSNVVSYALGVLSVLFVQEVASTPFRYQDPFVTAEAASGPRPVGVSIEPFFYEIRRQANTEGFAIVTPFDGSMRLAYCNAFRPGRTNPVDALFKFEEQFPGCLAVSRSSGTNMTRLSIEPGPAMTEPVAFYLPDDSSLGTIGFCGCSEADRAAYIERNAKLFGPQN